MIGTLSLFINMGNRVLFDEISEVLMSIFSQANSTAMRRVLAIKFAIVLNCLYPSAGFSADADAAVGQRRASICNACHGQ